MNLRTSFAKHLADARNMEPSHELTRPRPLRALRRVQSIAVFALLDVNDWLIGRLGPRPAIWPTATWPWIDELEAATPVIRAEFEAYATAFLLPHVAALSGLDPDSEEARASVPTSKGTWRTLLLYGGGRWIDETARHFPETVRLMSRVTAKANLGFSALDARSHLAAHVGPNRGAVRLQLPIIVPGALGDARIRIGDEIVAWEEGRAVVFDLSANHEAWNDTDEQRVLLMAELPMPLPFPQALVNRVAQHCYRWHPSFRGMVERARALSRAQARVPGGDAPVVPGLG